VYNSLVKRGYLQPELRGFKSQRGQEFAVAITTPIKLSGLRVAQLMPGRGPAHFTQVSEVEYMLKFISMPLYALKVVSAGTTANSTCVCLR
jgi:hypothetical protein